MLSLDSDLDVQSNSETQIDAYALEEELRQVSEDIEALRMALASKINRANDIKKKLGLSTLNVLPLTVSEGLTKLSESET
ncbi:unnamed protein product [Protopolystoma xenopodis]|uniref:Uncharacterized protein n=1 Tax=Protopolystoma xenopodis TaxID=117903 RepID=A0A448WQN4_9PLAT|nr:unnamed protein product [Protopolystoma xenopodis]